MSEDKRRQCEVENIGDWTHSRQEEWMGQDSMVSDDKDKSPLENEVKGDKGNDGAIIYAQNR